MKNKFLNIILLGILIFSSVFFVFEKPVRAESLIIQPSNTDARVEETDPEKNFGNLVELKIKSKNSDNKRTFIKFDLSSIPANALISEAHLELYLTDAPGNSRQYGIYAVLNSWDEGTINWDNQVNATSTPTTIISYGGSGVPAKVWLSWDVTPDAIYFYNNPAQNFSWMIKDQNERETIGREAVFRSNNYSTDLTIRPKLTIVYTASQPLPVCDNDSICETGENSDNCPADCSIQQNPICGNNIKEMGEDCDGVDLSGQTCVSQGFTGGVLSCNSSCTFNLSGCTNNNGGGSEIYVPHQVEPGDILINEIFPEPNATKSESEWIELYNHTDDAALDLTGWTLEDNTAKSVILSGIILAPRQYYALDKSKFSFALNNGGDTLILKNNQVIIDQVAYGDYEDGNIDDNAPAPGLSKSVGRRTSEPIDTNNDKNDFSICQSVTSGRANDVKTADSSQSTAISSANVPVIISEFLSNPSGSDNNEWIELYNPGSSAVDLTGWQVDDGEGGSGPYTLPSNTTMAAGGYLVLPWSQTKIVLNNNFDAVRLIRPDKVIKEQINYKDPPEGASYARDNSDSWEYTSVLTPGSANIFNVDDIAGGDIDKTVLTQDLSEDSNGANLDLVEVDNLPQLDNGQAATIQGLVVAPPNLFAKSYFYLNGAQIYSFAAKFPDLQIGDLIEVKGIVSASFSGRRLKIKSADDIQVLEHQNLSPQPVAISELDDSLIGHFLQISGQLVDKTGNKLYLDDNQGEVEVYLSPAIKWNKNLFIEGQNLQVSGVLAEAKEGWRLLPRCDNDLVVSAAIIDNSLSDSQNQATVENQNNPSITKLASSTATVWQNLNRPAAIKYLFLSAGIIIIFLAGVFLKLRGVI